MDRYFRGAVLGEWAVGALTVAMLVCSCGDRREASGERPLQATDARASGDGAGGASVIDASAPIDAGPAIAHLVANSGDEREALRTAGAVSAWRAVVDRTNYLARRQQRGAVYGRLGPMVEALAAPVTGGSDAGPIGSQPGPTSPSYQWLIDETDGSGSLTIRLALPRTLQVPRHPDDPLREGQRVIAWGAWHVGPDSQWYWQADKLARLPERAWSLAADLRAAPGHVIVDISTPPAQTKPISEISNRGGFVSFQVVRASDDPADGWEVADSSKDRPVARLYLPGERESYGAQDWRTPEEHWQLARSTRYVVRLKRFLPAKEGELPLMRALDAPRRVVGKKSRRQ